MNAKPEISTYNILSILICTLEERKEQLDKLLRHLRSQIINPDEVEILINSDNREKTTGAKRNELLEQAKGKYILFIDDDDWVPEYFINELLKASESGADCFATNGIMFYVLKNISIQFFFSKDYTDHTLWVGNKPIYIRRTNHISPVKRELALQAGFPDITIHEDTVYSERLNRFLKTEYLIEKPMYEYMDNKSY